MYQYTADQYEVLYQEAAGPVTAERIALGRTGAQRTQTTTAGDMLYIRSYPVWKTSGDGGRAKRVKPTKEAQRKLNQRNRRLYVEQLAHANFGREDYYLTLTYTETPRQGMRLTDDYWYDEPLDMDDAKKHLSAYLTRLKRRVRRLGGDLKYIAVTEETWSRHADAHDDHARYHHHLILSCPSVSRDEVEQLWQDMGHSAGRTNCQRLQPDGSGIAALAQYIMKAEDGEKRRDRNGKLYYQHRYTCSRNLKKPVTRTSDHKISRRRVAMVAMDVMHDGMDIFRALYPGYEPTEAPRIYISDYVAGAYIYCRMRRRT